jgi:hypothetical protein
MATLKKAVCSYHFVRCLIIFVMTFFFSVMAGTAFAANLTLAWDPNSEPDLTGYRVYCGESSRSYNDNLTKEVSSGTTTCEFTNLKEGTTYYFAAQAVSQTGESAYSQEISYTVPAAPTDPQDIDSDGDGFTENNDCDDTDSSIHPGATDECGDGIDQDCSGADVACPDDTSLAREAQAGELIGGFETRSDPAASSGTYVYVPNGVGTRMDGPDDTHKIIYTFNILEKGTYRIKGTVYAASGSDDSFWVKVNDDPADGYLWDVLQNTGYQQDYVNDRNGADPVEVSLLAGVNTVTVYLREDGTRLDTIELEPVATTAPASDLDGDGQTAAQGDCNDNNATVYLSATEICGDGIDQDCSGADLTCSEDVGMAKEAEDGNLIGAFEIGSDPAASGGRYVYVPGWTSSSTPNEAKKVEYTFNVSSPGNYRIRAWVYAPDTARDSFFVKVNDSPSDGYTWHVLRNTVYSQDYVRDGVGTDPVEIWLDKKPTTVTVYQREAGTRLDRIELEPVGTSLPLSDNDGDGFTVAQGDCDDNSADVYPDSEEICGDGIDQDCSGADVACPDDTSLAREAQAGELVGGFETRSDPAASSGTYVYAPNGVGTRMDGPDDTHKIIYTFNILEEGTYRIKGTVYAANGSDDSFWVKVNGDPADGYLWDVLQNTGYQQDYVNDRNGADPVEVSLQTGVNTVTVYLREDGTRLDTIELEPVATTAPASDLNGAFEIEKVISEVRVADGSDDAEENAYGSVRTSSSDLELTYDRSYQTVGMRFSGTAIPKGADIVNAYIQFQADETQWGATSLTIEGEDADNAGAFSDLTGNISSRTRTSAAVSWSPPAWTTVGEAGPDQRTPDIASVIQEIVDRSGWSSDNAMVLIITGSGERVAESYDGNSAGAPLLHVEYKPGN